MNVYIRKEIDMPINSYSPENLRFRFTKLTVFMGMLALALTSCWGLGIAPPTSEATGSSQSESETVDDTDASTEIDVFGNPETVVDDSTVVNLEPIDGVYHDMGADDYNIPELVSLARTAGIINKIANPSSNNVYVAVIIIDGKQYKIPSATDLPAAVSNAKDANGILPPGTQGFIALDD